MKRLLIGLLAGIVVIVVLVLVLRPHGKGLRHGHMQFTDLYHEASGPVSPDSLGAPWPDDRALAAIRADWHALGFRDSMICEELAREWIYPAGQSPERLPNVAQTPTGRNLGIFDRLDLGEKFLAHPDWRMGSMRHVPVLAGMLTSDEKSVLAFLAGGDTAAVSEPALARNLGLALPAVKAAVAALDSVGWLTVAGAADSSLYNVVDPGIGRGGALQYVRFAPEGGRAVDMVSVEAAFRRVPPMEMQSVDFRGPCARTGRSISMEIDGGRLTRGRPGNAWAAVISPPGLSDGLFASERAFEAWKGNHPQAQIAFSGTLPAVYHQVLQSVPPRPGDADRAGRRNWAPPEGRPASSGPGKRTPEPLGALLTQVAHLQRQA